MNRLDGYGSRRERGGTLIEVLVTLVILMLGLLGLVGLMLLSQRSQLESYQRVQALVILEDMANRIRTNRKVANCYAFTDVASGTPFLGTGSTTTPTCASGTAEQQNRVVEDMAAWNNLLRGTTEMIGTKEVGGMLNARGCVQLVSPNVYMVTMVWQGNSETFPPTAEATCATGQYGAEAQRRAISVKVQIANLS